MNRLLIITLLLYFLKNDSASAQGDQLFSSPLIHDIQMHFSQPAYWDSLIDTHLDERYVRGVVSIDGLVIGDCGVKMKGNSSFTNQSRKKSFKIDFNEYVSGQNFDGLKKINLNNGFKDPTFLREKLTLDFCIQQGLAAPRCTYARVFINNVYWGLYMLIEEVDTQEFLDRTFNNSAGNCFKGDPTGDLRWLGQFDSLYYHKYELCTNEFLNDWSDLVDLINTINNSGNNLYDSLQEKLNTSSFIQQWAALTMFLNLDSYLGSGHNYFIYHDVLTDKFEWITWDVNESFGTFRMNMNPTQVLNLQYTSAPSPPGSRPLIQNMATVPAFTTELAYVLCDWLQDDFTNAALDPKIDSIANRIRPHVYTDTLKFYSNSDFDNNLAADVGASFGLKSYISRRRTALMNQLGNLCLTSFESAVSSEDIKFYPQPCDGTFTFELANSSGENLRIVDLAGQVVHTEQLNADQTRVQTTLPAGYYLLQCAGRTGRLIITSK